MTTVDGYVAPGFERVRTLFEQNFRERGEVGAAVAAYWRDEKVVDLWGGRRSPDGDKPWLADTMVVVFSSTKGMAATTLALAHARGWLDYDAPVATYWPEFAQRGKQAITVRQLLAHEAGLVELDEKLTVDDLHDLDRVSWVLARQKPAWEPGTRHGYHAMTIGLYMQELIRRIDPLRRTLGRVFRDEIASPLGIDFFIGLPREIPGERLAKVQSLSWRRGIKAMSSASPLTILRMFLPWSLLYRSLLFTDVDWNDRHNLETEVPAGNGVGTARALARVYAALASGGEALGLGPATLEAVTAWPGQRMGRDVVIGEPTLFSLGFLRPLPGAEFGTSRRAFGAPGAGGSFAFADPNTGLGYAYVMNKMDYHLFDDPREKPLRDEVHRVIARLSTD